MTAKKKAILYGVGAVLCLILTIACRILSDNEDVEFEKVQVRVVTSENKQVRVAGKTTTRPSVKVSYNGETYDLQNVYNSYSYRTGSTVTAYLAHGKLYANEAGVQTSTPLFYAYIGFLVATFVLVILFFCQLPVVFRKV